MVHKLVDVVVDESLDRDPGRISTNSKMDGEQREANEHPGLPFVGRVVCSFHR